MEVLQEVLEERKRSVVKVSGSARGGGSMGATTRGHGDFLDHVVQEITKEKPLVTDRMALDLMFVLLFAGFHTTSLALTLAVKLLADHPRVLEELTVRNTYRAQYILSLCMHTLMHASICALIFGLAAGGA